ncbi:hypothetical protein, partial [Pseudomonas syringae]
SGRYLGRSFLCLQRCNQRASIDDFTEHLFLRQYTSAWSGNASANTRSVLAAIVGSWLELSVVSIADAMAVRTSLSEGLSGLIELDFELCTTSW